MVQTLLHPAPARSATPGKAAAFGWHFLEMCAAMCVAWMVVTIPFVLLARAAGTADPVRSWPEVTTLVALVAMSAGMAAEMRWRRHSWRCVGEMSGAMLVEAVILIALGATGLLPRADLFAWFHGLMPFAMVAAMLPRLDVYTSPFGHHGDAAVSH